MKMSFRFFALSMIILGATNCATQGLRVIPSQAALPSQKCEPNQVFSISAVKQEIKDCHFEHAARLLDIASAPTQQEEIEIHLYRGILHSFQNRLEASLADFKKCRELTETTTGSDLNALVCKRMANVYRDLQDYKNAASCLRAYQELTGEDKFNSDITFYERFPGPAHEIECPTGSTSLKMESHRGLPCVNGRINDMLDARFLVDTGAAMSVLSSDIAKKLGIQPLDTGIEVGGAVHSTSGYRGVIDSLKLGDAEIRNVPVLIIDSSALTFKLLGKFPYLKIDAILGLPLLKLFDVTFRFKDQGLTLGIPPATPYPPEFAGNFYLINNMVVLPVAINNEGLLHSCLIPAAKALVR